MNYLSFIENKIVREKETLIHTLSQWRFKEEKIVFTNGCFDILHRGHRRKLPLLSSKFIKPPICNGVAIALPSTCRLIRQNEDRNFDCLHIFVWNRVDTFTGNLLH